MDGNRDEAERCIEIAVIALREAKLDKAEKFLKKAETLYPTQKAKDILEKVLQAAKENVTDEPNPPKTTTFRRRTTSPNAKPEKVEPDFTNEQVEIVKKVKKCKDYYEILGVTKESTDSEIKKAYKKLALQLHPDKNKAPGAAEAFKAVGNAVATLTDAEKRKAYDLYGADEANNGMRRQNYHRHHNSGFAYTQGFESDVTAEELFNMFFGGGFPQQQNVFMRQRRFHRAEQQQARGEAQSGYSALINLLPILLLISLSMMSSFFISDPIYSLQPSHKYSIERKTNTYKISYYVKDNFHSEYQGSLGRLEASVEEEYINNLKHACYREKNYKESMFIRARSFGDREIYRKAQAVATPSCDQLQKMQNI